MALIVRDPPKFEPSEIFTNGANKLLLSAEPLNLAEWKSVFAPPYNVRRIVRCLPKENPLDDAVKRYIDELNSDERKQRICIHHVPIHDIRQESILPHLAASIRFVSESLSFEAQEEESQGVSTLIHCQAGVSRSASIAVAFMMAHRKLPLKTAYEHVQQRREVARPNVGFFQQLLQFESTIPELSSAAPSVNLDEYVLAGYMKRFRSQLPEEEIHDIFLKKGLPHHPQAMQMHVFEFLCEKESRGKKAAGAAAAAGGGENDDKKNEE